MEDIYLKILIDNIILKTIKFNDALFAIEIKNSKSGVGFTLSGGYPCFWWALSDLSGCHLGRIYRRHEEKDTRVRDTLSFLEHLARSSRLFTPEFPAYFLFITTGFIFMFGFLCSQRRIKIRISKKKKLSGKNDDQLTWHADTPKCSGIIKTGTVVLTGMRLALVDICFTSWSRESLGTVAGKRTRCIHADSIVLARRTCNYKK